MTDKILCKYFLHGACKKGEACPFSHSWKAPPSMVCTYYQRGCCSFGSGCRYDHVKDPKAAALRVSGAGTPSNANPNPNSNSGNRLASSSTASISSAMAPRASSIIGSSRGVSGRGTGAVVGGGGGGGGYGSDLRGGSLGNDGVSPWGRRASNVRSVEWANDDKNGSRWTQVGSEPLDDAPRDGNGGAEVGGWTRSSHVKPEDQPLCSFAAAGDCPRGDTCTQLHGELCNICGKRCLHPYRQREWAEHRAICEKREKKLASLRMSQEIECSVCLEKVLSKPAVAERKFGILSGCDHPFCIGCIRGWRNGCHTAGLDLETVVRACPVCRVQSHFVTPSVVWYFTTEEKEELVHGYKNKLSGIDCKYFDYGHGTCPFGTSCFYRHVHHDGRKEDVKLRYLGTSEGDVKIASSIRLSEFLQDMNLEDGGGARRSSRVRG